MARLTAEEIVHERDPKGNLLPVEVSLELLKEEEKEAPTASILPLTRAEFRLLLRGLDAHGKKLEDADAYIIKKHCKDPALDDEKLKYIKPGYPEALMVAILSVSLGMKQQEVKEAYRAGLQALAQAKKEKDKELEEKKKFVQTEN